VAVFLRYAELPDYRDIVNRIIESKEALKVASELLMSISQDERERAIFRSRRMYQSDLESNMLTARREGRAEGRAEGEKAKAYAIAKKALLNNIFIDDIVDITGLTRDEIENLSDAD
jgi:predicted transposase/invertase (TIGR01784 family)